MSEALSIQPESVLSPLDWKRFRDDIHPHRPILVVDARARIQHLTPAGRSLLEYGTGQDLPTLVFALIHDKHLYRAMRDVADMVCYRRKQASWMLRLRTGQGRWRWYQATAENHLHETPPTIQVRLRDLHE